MTKARTRGRAGRFALMVSIVLLALGAVASAMASGATVDRIEGPFVTVVPSAYPDNAIGVELMFAECDVVKTVELPDGSATETQKCELTGPFVEFPGTPPDQVFLDVAGECVWGSDYWRLASGGTVIASSYRLTVTPSGRVHITSRYAADPLTPEDCGL